MTKFFMKRIFCTVFIVHYCAQENFGEEKLANLVNCKLFAKIFLTNIHRYTRMYLACALTVAYSQSFPCLHQYGFSKFSPPKFSCVQYTEDLVCIIIPDYQQSGHIL